MLKKDPGFNNAQQLLVLEKEGALGTNAGAFKETIATIPGVHNVTSSSSVPGTMTIITGTHWKGKKMRQYLFGQTSWIIISCKHTTWNFSREDSSIKSILLMHRLVSLMNLL